MATPGPVAVVYLLRCRDGTFYTGWTIDLAARLRRHQTGRAARYTRGRRPVALVYAEPCPDRTAARRREWSLRRLSHREKAAIASISRSPAATGSRRGSGASRARRTAVSSA